MESSNNIDKVLPSSSNSTANDDDKFKKPADATSKSIYLLKNQAESSSTPTLNETTTSLETNTNEVLVKCTKPQEQVCNIGNNDANCSGDQDMELSESRAILLGSSDVLHNVQTKRKNVNLIAESSGPSIYTLNSAALTPPMIPGKLPEAFSSLPVFKEVDNLDNLAQLKRKLLHDFVNPDMKDEEFESLMEYCSPENLKLGNEMKMQTKQPVSVISSIKATKEHFSNTPGSRGELDHLHTLRKYRQQKDSLNIFSSVLKQKYRGIRFYNIGELEETDKDAIERPLPPPESLLVPGKDLIFRVRIYRPFSYSPLERKKSVARHPIFSSDLLVLGRHRLSDLRDRISCPNDVGLRIDLSNMPQIMPTSSSKELFPSGFLFINNTFYCDSRAGCQHYCAAVRDWAPSAAHHHMDHTTIGQMTLRLGFPEVYIHQGNCEHLLTFSEVRLVTYSDQLDASLYPCVTQATQNHSIHCTTCAEYLAKWVVTECERVPFDPAFFCDICFKLYLYKDGQKLGTFKAFPFTGNEIQFK